MFYFHKGEIEQFLAAKELMANSWRYYNKFSIWLKRNSQANIDPNNEYETGNYYCYGAELSMKERRQIKVYHRYLVQEIWASDIKPWQTNDFISTKFYLSILLIVWSFKSNLINMIKKGTLSNSKLINLFKNQDNYKQLTSFYL